MAVLYVDVSHHDWSRRGGNLGWDKIRAATSGAMIARATYGDPDGWHRSSAHHLDFHRAARAAGFDLRGSYHNLTNGNASRQVDWLRREMDEAGAVWAMADVERYPEMMSAGTYPRWSDVLRFQEAWYAKESRVMAWYLPEWVWSRSDMGRPDLSVLRGPLVSSRYPLSYTQDDPADLYRRCGGDSGKGWGSYGGKTPQLWQFSSSALVPGTTGGADCNAFRGTYAELRSLLHPSSNAVQEEDTMSADDATIGFVRALNYAAEPDNPAWTDQQAQYGRQIRDGLRKVLAPLVAAESASPAEIRDMLAQVGTPGGMTPDQFVDALAARLQVPPSA